jgi:hypothetical protein
VRQRHAVATREVLWASSPATQLPPPPSTTHRRYDSCAQDASAPQSPRRSHDLRVRPMRRTVRRRPPLRILQLVLRCPGTGRGVSGLRPPRSRRRPARRGGVHQGVNPQRRANRRGYAALLAQSLDNPPGSGGPLQVDHIPTPGCYDDGVVLPRFSISYPDPKTAGDYHHDHPHTAADVALRVPVLSRQNLNQRPTFIPALTGIDCRHTVRA